MSDDEDNEGEEEVEEEDDDGDEEDDEDDKDEDEDEDEDDNDDEDKPPFADAIQPGGKKGGKKGVKKRRKGGIKSEYAPFDSSSSGDNKRTATLHQISHVEVDVRARLETYINTGMQLDHMYIEKLYGRVNPSINRDYDYFWESPWVEEHVNDNNKRRRIEEQQKNYAFRSVIRANATSAKKLKQNMQLMQEWGNISEAKDYIRTVSRVVQSFEAKAIQRVITAISPGALRRPIAQYHLARLCNSPAGSLTVVGDLTTAANTLRRNPITRDLLISIVTAELLLANTNGGGQIGVIHQSKFLQCERDTATIQMLNALQVCTEDQLPMDTVGMPLMEVNSSICVRHGVLIVRQNKDDPQYVMVFNDNKTKLEANTQITIDEIFTETNEDDDLFEDRDNNRVKFGIQMRSRPSDVLLKKAKSG